MTEKQKDNMINFRVNDKEEEDLKLLMKALCTDNMSKAVKTAIKITKEVLLLRCD